MDLGGAIGGALAQAVQQIMHHSSPVPPPPPPGGPPDDGWRPPPGYVDPTIPFGQRGPVHLLPFDTAQPSPWHGFSDGLGVPMKPGYFWPWEQTPPPLHFIDQDIPAIAAALRVATDSAQRYRNYLHTT